MRRKKKVKVEVGGMVHRGGLEYRINLRTHSRIVARDQRAFGPRKLVVVFAEMDGNVISIAHTDRLDPPEAGIVPCIARLGCDASIAMAFCDEEVVAGPPPHDLRERFGYAYDAASRWGVHLLDWVACDDLLFRSTRAVLFPDEDEWPYSAY